MRIKRLWCEEKKSKHSRHWLWLQFVMYSFFLSCLSNTFFSRRNEPQVRDRNCIFLGSFLSVSLSFQWLGCLFFENQEKDLPAREIKDATTNESNNSHNRLWKGTESRNEEMKKDACLKFTGVWKESNHDVSRVVSSVLLTSFSLTQDTHLNFFTSSFSPCVVSSQEHVQFQEHFIWVLVKWLQP